MIKIVIRNINYMVVFKTVKLELINKQQCTNWDTNERLINNHCSYD